MSMTEALDWCKSHSKDASNEMLLKMLECNNKVGVIELTEEEATDFVNKMSLNTK